MSSNSNNESLAQLKAYIEKNEFEKALNFLKADQSLPINIKKYNQAYLNYKLGNLVEAKILMESAELHGMLTEQSLFSLKTVNEELGITYVEDQTPILESAYLKIPVLPSSLLLLFYGFFGALLVLSLVKRWLLLFGPVCLTLILSGLMHYKVSSLDFNYVLEETVVRRGPSVIFEETSILLPGVKILTSKKSDKWVYIEYPSMFSGWFKKEQE